MPKFEVIPIEEAKEATKIADWLDEKFGEEQDIVPYYGDCNCNSSCTEPATQLHPVLERVMVCDDCFDGLEAELNDDSVVHYHAGTVIE